MHNKLSPGIVFIIIGFSFLGFSCTSTAESVVDEKPLIEMDIGSLAFHMIDSEATYDFLDYYDNNPDNTFNELGELNDPLLLPPDVVLIGVYLNGEQWLTEQGNPWFYAVKREVGLGGNHIVDFDWVRSAVNENWYRITLYIDDEGQEIYYRLASANVGRLLALVYNDRVVTYREIEESFNNDSISFYMATVEALELIELLSACL